MNQREFREEIHRDSDYIQGELPPQDDGWKVVIVDTPEGPKRMRRRLKRKAPKQRRSPLWKIVVGAAVLIGEYITGQNGSFRRAIAKGYTSRYSTCILRIALDIASRYY